MIKARAIPSIKDYYDSVARF